MKTKQKKMIIIALNTQINQNDYNSHFITRSNYYYYYSI
jgi:hypothetical protein